MRTNKTKDMIRSVLPSTARKGARHAKANRKRRVRRHVRQDLHREDFEPKADLKLDARLSDVVWDRRGADKLNHFMRWCEAKTKGVDTDDALGYVRSILPSSLIGDHAYGHWKAHRMRHQFRFRYEPPQSLQSYIDSTTCRLKRALDVAPDLHHALNASIKREKVEGDPRRLLRGVHDVDAFVRDTAWPDKRGDDDLFYIERRVTRDLIDRVEKGGREAALDVFALCFSVLMMPV